MHPSGVAKLSTSFGWGKGGNVTFAGWQVTLCDPMWHVSSRSGVATLRTAIHSLLTCYYYDDDDDDDDYDDYYYTRVYLCPCTCDAQNAKL